MQRSDRLVVHGRSRTVNSGRHIPAAPQRVWTEKSQQQQQKEQKKEMPRNYNILRLQDSRPNTTSSAGTLSNSNSNLSTYPNSGGVGVLSTSVQDSHSPLVQSSSSLSQYQFHQSQYQSPQNQSQYPQTQSQYQSQSQYPEQLGNSTTAGGGGGPTSLLEGPLPAEVREIIYSQCTGDDAEVAERHARRLLSTNRRVRVYREELQSAMEEVRDVAAIVQRHHTVQQALMRELQELDNRIAQLLRERQVCEAQQQQEEQTSQRMEAKLRDAKERVEVLRSTIDSITKESMTGYLLLQQLVPNLHVDNYIT